MKKNDYSMGIEAFINRNLKQTAVRWTKPHLTPSTELAYSPPDEIACTWTSTQEMVRNDEGKEVFVTTKIYVGIDLNAHDMIYLGRLSDLTEAQLRDPSKVYRAHEIKKFEKTPSMRNPNEFVRKAYI